MKNCKQLFFLKQIDFDMLTIDLRMDAPFAKENLNVKWHCESGFVDNIQKLIKEYKTARNLVV